MRQTKKLNCGHQKFINKRHKAMNNFNRRGIKKQMTKIMKNFIKNLFFKFYLHGKCQHKFFISHFQNKK